MFIVRLAQSRAMMNRRETDSRPVFTPRQGQHLAIIHAYTLVNGRPPAEADMILPELNPGHVQPVKITVTQF
jgi:hypothetical protein